MWNDLTKRLPGDKMIKLGNVLAVERNVTKITLTSILDYVSAPRVMHYLDLDSDGTEHLVLQGLDHKRYTFHVVTVDRPKYRTHVLLAKHGYRYLYQLSPMGECIYIHQNKHDIVDIFARRHRPEVIPSWHNSARPYLLYPMWNQTLSGEDMHFAPSK
jgi:hypothetical protein